MTECLRRRPLAHIYVMCNQNGDVSHITVGYTYRDIDRCNSPHDTVG